MFGVSPYLYERRLRRKFWRQTQNVIATYSVVKDKIAISGDLDQREQALDKSADRLREIETSLLVLTAIVYDITPPPQSDTSSWESSSAGNVLTLKAIHSLRTQIDKEKTRRFEVRVRWLKLLTPIITALIGLLGTLIGVIFALKK
jgi:hypothetical protein